MREIVPTFKVRQVGDAISASHLCTGVTPPTLLPPHPPPCCPPTQMCSLITARLSATCYRKNPPSSRTHAIPVLINLSAPSLWAPPPPPSSKCLHTPPTHPHSRLEWQSGAAYGRKMSHKLFVFQSLSRPSWWNHAIRSGRCGFPD